MHQEKQKYINEQLNIDFILKSKNSALAFIFVSILFMFLHRQQDDYKAYITVLSISVTVLSIIRYFNVTRFLEKKLATEEAVRNVTITALLNAVFWSIIGVLSVLSYKEVSIHILITFIILISFSASSVVTLSHKKWTFNGVNFLVSIPQATYAIFMFIKTENIDSLWLLAYTSISLFYTWRQAKVIQAELRKNFSTEYELKKSLEKVALSKKHLEEESAKTFHASRLSSLGEMAGGIAHEINNPLTIIQGLTKSILGRDKDNIDEQIQLKLTKINQATERIAKIVKGMKIISSKNDQIEHESVKVSKVLDLSIGLFEERLKNEEIQFSLQNLVDPNIYCNPLQVSQIIINLISNALDAIVSNNSQGMLTIKVTEDLLSNTVDIRVINSGPLIPSEISTKIFEPFFSTKSMGKGTGLGLSISQTLAHSNGGVLNYEVYDGNVCFKLHLSSHIEV